MSIGIHVSYKEYWNTRIGEIFKKVIDKAAISAIIVFQEKKIGLLRSYLIVQNADPSKNYCLRTNIFCNSNKKTRKVTIHFKELIHYEVGKKVRKVIVDIGRMMPKECQYQRKA